MKPMPRTQVEKALRMAGCLPVASSGRGDHTKWTCPCKSHTANIPRHRTISPGVLASTIKRLTCLPKGWLA